MEKIASKSKIISAPYCMGKSTVGRMKSKYVDLDSSIYYTEKTETGLKSYVDIIEKEYNRGNTPLVSAHPEVRKEMFDRGLPYVYVVPEDTQDSKDIMIKRNKLRVNRLPDDVIEKTYDKIFIEPDYEEKRIILPIQWVYLKDILSLINGATICELLYERIDIERVFAGEDNIWNALTTYRTTDDSIFLAEWLSTVDNMLNIQYTIYTEKGKVFVNVTEEHE